MLLLLLLLLLLLPLLVEAALQAWVVAPLQGQRRRGHSSLPHPPVSLP